MSGRRIVDQAGNPYLMKVFSSWGMAQNLTNAEITTALEGVAKRGFNAVNVAPNGVGIQDDWVKYENISGQNFFEGAPFASPLGPAWATMDHLVAEAQRLGITVLFSFFVSYGDSGIGPELTAASDKNAYDYGVAVASRYRDAPNIVWHVEADTGWQPEDPIGRRLDNIFHGIADTETTPRLIVAEPYLDGTGYQMFLSEEGSGNSGYQWLHLSTNAVYDYGDNAVEQFDRVWNEPGATATRCGTPSRPMPRRPTTAAISAPSCASATTRRSSEGARGSTTATRIGGPSASSVSSVADSSGPRCRTRRRRRTPNSRGA